jgi:hypothetical protein
VIGGHSTRGDKAYLVSDPFLLPSSVELGLTSQLELSLPFQDPPSLQIVVLGSIVARAGIVRIGNGRVFVVAEIRVVGGSSGALHLLPTEEFSVTGSLFALASSTLSSDRPGVRILGARVAVAVGSVAVVGWSIKPHLWRV